MTETAERSIASWEKFAPGYEVQRWDETNAPIDACAFVRGAYAAGRWAFVSDYVRFRVLYEHGGMYMDVGSELVKDISPLEACSPFSAIEDSTKTANTGLVASCEASNPVVANVLCAYEHMEFVDDFEFLSSHTVNEMFTQELERHGFVREDRLQHVAGWTLLPCEYFNPVYGLGGYHIKQNTYSVHRGSGSWVAPEFQMKKRISEKIAPFVGRRAGQIIGRIIMEFKCNGLVAGSWNLAGVTKEVLKRKGLAK